MKRAHSTEVHQSSADIFSLVAQAQLVVHRQMGTWQAQSIKRAHLFPGKLLCTENQSLESLQTSKQIHSSQAIPMLSVTFMSVVSPVDFEMDIEDSSYLQISCSPSRMATKVLVGIVDVAVANGKTTYAIRSVLGNSNLEWMVHRRYSEFLELRDDLLAFFARRMVQQCFGCRWFFQSLNGFDFPRRHLLHSQCPEVVRQRKSSLDQFARLLASHTFSAIPKCVSCSKLPFARVRDFFVKSATIPPLLSFKIIYNALAPENFSAIADPKKSKIESRRGHGIVKMLQVEKPVHSKRASQDKAYRKQVKQDQQRAMLERKMSFHQPGYRVPTTTKEDDDGRQETATIAHIEEIHASDDGSDEEDSSLAVARDDELDMTGVEIDISMDASARRFASSRGRTCGSPGSLRRPRKPSPRSRPDQRHVLQMRRLLVFINTSATMAVFIIMPHSEHWRALPRRALGLFEWWRKSSPCEEATLRAGALCFRHFCALQPQRTKLVGSIRGSEAWS